MQQTVAKSNASISLLLWEKGDHAVVDEEFYLSFVWLLLQQPPTAIAEWAIAARRAGEAS